LHNEHLYGFYSVIEMLKLDDEFANGGVEPQVSTSGL